MAVVNKALPMEVSEKPKKLINDLVFLRKLAALKVLIVDDQKNMIKTIENMLTHICAFKLKSQCINRAENGEEAVGILVNQPPKLPHKIELVLLDWNMPRMPGIEVIRAIRTSEFEFVRNVPVIMITGEADKMDVTEAVYAGVDDYLLKPFVMDDMRERMNPLMRRFWSKMKIHRVADRRSETRYPATALSMALELEFSNGEKKMADIINISREGLRVSLEKPAVFDAKILKFSTSETSKNLENVCKCTVMPPTINPEDAKIQFSISIKGGFGDETVEARWTRWLEMAKERYLSYRGQHF